MRVPIFIKTPEELKSSIESGIMDIIEEQIEMMQEEREESTP